MHLKTGCRGRWLPSRAHEFLVKGDLNGLTTKLVSLRIDYLNRLQKSLADVLPVLALVKRSPPAETPPWRQGVPGLLFDYGTGTSGILAKKELGC